MIPYRTPLPNTASRIFATIVMNSFYKYLLHDELSMKGSKDRHARGHSGLLSFSRRLSLGSQASSRCSSSICGFCPRHDVNFRADRHLVAMSLVLNPIHNKQGASCGRYTAVPVGTSTCLWVQLEEYSLSRTVIFDNLLF